MSFCAFSQEKNLKLRTKDAEFYLRIYSDSLYELDGMHNLICVGTVEWEKGTIKKRKNKLILYSEKPEVETSAIKIVLKRKRKLKENRHFYFTSKEECWKIKSVKNKEFVKHVLIKRESNGEK
jgi:hypothetical protein